MKVKDLIVELGKLNPDAEVYIETENADHFTIDNVFAYGYETVYLDCLKMGW